MFHYSICNIADESVFQKQCKALEKFVPQIRKEELLHDVDGSLTQLYSADGKLISVHNSKYIESVYVDSEIELNQYFKK